MRLVATIGLILSAVAVTGARAEIEYPYCLVPGGFNVGTCTYTTYEQCAASASAGAGFCTPNPRYVASPPPRQVRGKR